MDSATGKPTRTSRAAECGQVILELLPVVTLMLILIFGVIDFGRAIWEMQVLTSLSREGSNLASRNVSLQDAANAVINDGAVLNLSQNGKIIITSVQNQAPNQRAQPQFVITGQYSTGSLSATSKVGTYNPNPRRGGNQASMPTETPVFPQPNATVYVTEIYSSYSPITPLGAFVKSVVPRTLYDIAYF